MKKITGLIISVFMLFSAFNVMAINVNNAYSEFKTEHPDFIESLTDNGISEATIKSFIKDVDDYLTELGKTTTITEGNFEKYAMNAVIDVSSREKYYELQDTLLILYPDAIKLAITQGKVSAEFRPLVNTVKKIYFGISDSNSNGGSGGGGSTSDEGLNGDDNSGNESSTDNEDLPVTPAPSVAFTDIDSSHWAYDSVINLSKKYILNGYLDGTFKPDNNITRAEFAKIIVSATNSVDPYAIAAFNDVSSSDWYYSYVATAYTMGYITGYPDGSFHPNDNITRADICTIVNRVIKASAGDNTSKFKDDSSIPMYAKDAVYALSLKGIVNGFSDNTFAPLSFATRAQTAKIVYGALFNNKE